MLMATILDEDKIIQTESLIAQFALRSSFGHLYKFV